LSAPRGRGDLQDTQFLRLDAGGRDARFDLMTVKRDLSDAKAVTEEVKR
jgi:hypothetical protein